MGSANFSGALISFNDLIRTSDGTLYASYSESSSLTHVAKWDGVSWSTLGGAPLDSTGGGFVQLALDSSENLLSVLFSNGYTRSIVQRWTGSTWTAVGSSQFAENRIVRPNIVVAPDDTISVAYVSSVNNTLSAMSYGKDYAARSLNWQESNPSPSTTLNANWSASTGSSASNQEIQYYADESCYLASGVLVNLLSTSTNTDATLGSTGLSKSYRVKTTFSSGEVRWSRCSQGIAVGPGWIPVSDSSSISQIAVTAATIGIDLSDTLYVAYSDYAAGNKLTVLKYVSGTWTVVGTRGFSSGTASSPSITFDSLGTPFVSYIDLGVSKLVVQTWNGSTWNTIGSASGISAGGTISPMIAVDSTGAPYVTYQDTANSNRATVLKWNGASWTALGGAGFTAAAIHSPTLAIDSTDSLWFSSVESGFVTLRNWNGASWVSIGVAGTTQVVGGFATMTLSPTNVPYIAYRDFTVGNKLVVKAWTGAWSTIGPVGGITVNSANNMSIVCDSTGAPYVAFQDWNASIKESVLKWNGAAWVNLGAAGFSTGQGTNSKLKIDSNDQLYLYYQDNQFPDAVILKRFAL